MISTFAGFLDWFGIVVFVTTGALVASRKQMDIVGFILLGTVTGIGGGTIRDILLGRLPVFWVSEPAYLVTCVAVSSGCFFWAHIPASRYAWLLRFDAIGLALFAVTGAETALGAGVHPFVAIAMGVTTATFGGILRDILSGEDPVILSREIYVTAALIGAATFVLLSMAGIGREVSLLSGFVGAAVVRLSALRWDWTLPRYHPRNNKNEKP